MKALLYRHTVKQAFTRFQPTSSSHNDDRLHNWSPKEWLTMSFKNPFQSRRQRMNLLSFLQKTFACLSSCIMRKCIKERQDNIQEDILTICGTKSKLQAKLTRSGTQIWASQYSFISHPPPQVWTDTAMGYTTFYKQNSPWRTQKIGCNAAGQRPLILPVISWGKITAHK